jgi:hypothetical protein
MIKKLLIVFPLIYVIFSGFTSISFAKTTMSISTNEGYAPYNGWITADMSISNKIVTKNAAYSMKIFRDFGLIPVAYCSSGGSHLGTYYTFYVNPYNDCLIVGKTGLAAHSAIFDGALKPFSLTGNFIYYTDLSSHQDLHRKIIKIAKEEFIKYQDLIK